MGLVVGMKSLDVKECEGVCFSCSSFNDSLSASHGFSQANQTYCSPEVPIFQLSDIDPEARDRSRHKLPKLS